jgi:hypothetical protein
MSGGICSSRAATIPLHNMGISRRQGKRRPHPNRRKGKTLISHKPKLLLNCRIIKTEETTFMVNNPRTPNSKLAFHTSPHQQLRPLCTPLQVCCKGLNSSPRPFSTRATSLTCPPQAIRSTHPSSHPSPPPTCAPTQKTTMER